MPRERREIKKQLLRKGFVEDNSGHTMFRLKVDGKMTGIKACLSHGSKYKDYSDSLLNLIKRELKLDTKSQLFRLLDCPLKYEDYVAYLRAKGLTL